MVKSLINSRKRYMTQKTAAFLVMLFVGMLVWTSFGNVASAADADLAQQYAPILYFEQNEKCYPVNVSYALDNSKLYQVGNPTPILTEPNASNIAAYTTKDYYLDNQRGTVTDNGITNDYQNKMAALGYTVYAHVDNTNNVIQYWFFYAFNGGDLNNHEGDWEMVQVHLSGGQPIEAMYSQHYAGQKATWNQVEKEGTHFKVYVAHGSHANYLRSYSGMIGIASDHVGNSGKVLKPADYTLTLLESQAWLNFGGHWGWAGSDTEQNVQSSILGQAGPQGPKYREFQDGQTMWADPLGWGATMSQANGTLFLLEWLLYNFMTLFIAFTALIFLAVIFLIYLRYKRYGLGPRIVSMLYIDGANAKSIGNILCIVGLIIAIVGLFLPWYSVSVNVNIPGYPKTGLTDLIKIDGLKGVQVILPDGNGPIPLGSFVLPFSALLAISIIFLILATVGIAQSKKLGRKYIGRGIRLLFPFIIAFVVIMILSSILPLIAPIGNTGNFDINDTVKAVSAAPFGGEKTVLIPDIPSGQVYLKWGFGLGLYLLLFAGIILIVAGGIEIAARSTFFEQRQFEKQKKKKKPETPAPAEEHKKE
jgi:hypothetical protein